MGFFKKLFGDAADELKKSIEDSKNEMRKSLEDMKRSAMADFSSRTSSKISDDDDDNDDEPRIILGKFSNGVLDIRDDIEELDDESLEDYKNVKMIIFPRGLKKLESDVIYDQSKLEELDFSFVTELKEIPDEFISGSTKIKEFIVPQGVKKLGDGFVGDCNAGTKIVIPSTVEKMGYINGENNNDLLVYLFAPNLNIEDAEEDIKTLYVLPEYYGYYAKKLKECDSEARLREMPEDMMNIYNALPEKKDVKNAAPLPEKAEKKELVKPSSLTPPDKMEFEMFDESENETLFEHGFRFVQVPESGDVIYDIVNLEDSDLYLRKTNDNRYYRFYMYSPGQLCVDKDFHAYSKVDHTEFDLARYFKDYENDETEGDSEYDIDKKLFYGVVKNAKAKPQEYLSLDWEFVQFDEEENEFLGKHGFTYPRDTDVIYDIVQHECGELFLSRTNNGHYFRIDPFNTGRLQIDADLQAYCLTEIKPFDFDRFCKDYENDEVENLDEYNIEDTKTFYTGVENTQMPKPVQESTSEQIKESGGIFSERLEAMIEAALRDGVLTDKERELLKKRAEKEGEDWDEVEMIIEARLAEIQPAAPATETPVSIATSPNSERMNIQSQMSQPQNVSIEKDTETIVYKGNDKDKDKLTIFVPEGVTELEDDCFCLRYNASFEMEEITLPSTLRKIGDSSFRNCRYLKSIVIPPNVEIIPNQAFEFCINLTSIVLPTAIRRIDHCAFGFCESLKSLAIPHGCKKINIDTSAFRRSNVKKLFLPPSLTSISKIDISKVFCFSSSLEELEPLVYNKRGGINEFLERTKRQILNYEDMIQRMEEAIAKGSSGFETRILDYKAKKEREESELNNFMEYCNCTCLYVLPQYVEVYKAQAEAELLTDKLAILPMPDEYLYYYDN